MADIQVGKGVKYGLVVDGPYDASNATLTAALTNVVGFGSARVVTAAEEGLDPAVVVAGIKADPSYVESSNRKLTVVMAQWTKPDGLISGEQFADANQNYFAWRAFQSLKVGQKNWTWVGPLVAMAGVLGGGAWLIERIERMRSRAKR